MLVAPVLRGVAGGRYSASALGRPVMIPRSRTYRGPMARKSAPRKRLSREARRQQLLEAALGAFGAGGYHGTHVDQIIERAGVARGTFYLHFSSKQEIFDALIDQMLQVFLDVRPAEQPEDIRTLEDAEGVLRASYRTVLTAFHENRRLMRLLLEEAVGLDRDYRQRLERHYRTWHARVASTLEMLVDQGLARRDLDAEVTAEMVLGMVERLTRRYLLRSRKPPLDRLVDALVTLELGGIRAI